MDDLGLKVPDQPGNAAGGNKIIFSAGSDGLKLQTRNIFKQVALDEFTVADSLDPMPASSESQGGIDKRPLRSTEPLR
jgi:hypothetical protein